MKLEEVKTWQDLIILMAERYPDLSLKKLAKTLGMSEKTLYDIKSAKKIPGKSKKRAIKGYMRKEEGMEIIELENEEIQLTIENAREEKGDIIEVAFIEKTTSEDDRLRYLLTKVMFLEEENTKLRALLNRDK